MYFIRYRMNLPNWSQSVIIRLEYRRQTILSTWMNIDFHLILLWFFAAVKGWRPLITLYYILRIIFILLWSNQNKRFFTASRWYNSWFRSPIRRKPFWKEMNNLMLLRKSGSRVPLTTSDKTIVPERSTNFLTLTYLSCNA